ncbi:unnamed protein product, partial [Prorocentrum cordatum]
MYFWSAGPLGPPRAAPPHPAPMADAPGEEAGAGSAVPPRKGPRVSWVLPEDALPAVAEELAPAALDEGPPTLRVRLGIPREEQRWRRPRGGRAAGRRGGAGPAAVLVPLAAGRGVRRRWPRAAAPRLRGPAPRCPAPR